MKAILIKTDEHKIEEVEFAGTLEDAYRLLGVTIIERVELGGNLDLWVDEEGLINGRGDQLGWFRYHPYQQALAGRGLITGVAQSEDPEEGETWGEVEISVEDVAEKVVWLP